MEKQLLEKGYRKYKGSTIDIFFNKDLCTRSTICVKGCPEVFDVNKRPWINPDGANLEKVVEVVDKCPSAALKYIIKEENLIAFIFDETRFYLNDAYGKMIAEVTFVISGDNALILNHTFLDPVLRGKGIALKLVEAVIKYAIDNDRKIVPLCPYAKRVFDKNKELHFLLHTT